MRDSLEIQIGLEGPVLFVLDRLSLVHQRHFLEMKPLLLGRTSTNFSRTMKLSRTMKTELTFDN